MPLPLATESRAVKDRRKELRPNTRLQLLSVSGRLSGLSAADLEKALTMLYVTQPLRWQTFMDEAQVVIDAAGEYDSGFRRDRAACRRLGPAEKICFHRWRGQACA
jgi:hypothetical protein